MGRKITPKLEEEDDAGSDVEHFMYQQSESTRIVMLHGDVTENSIAMVTAQLIHLSTQNNKPIKLVISTYGGAIDEMLSLYDVINMINCPVHTIALGKVMSAGVLLLASGEKGKRVIGKNTRLMIHSLRGQIGGNIFEITNHVEEQKRLQNLIVDLMILETKMTKKQLEELMSEKLDHYITPDHAVKLGIVDIVA